ncbi:hypothetical protein Trichorick_01293 [Candidatus Trichorickettsia mobilis]|uniref:Uncharacterized protein n=1 Tax=Candidatus Trichorickettsia mobilis TaxID=1346319 RepID=A0ABZ0UTM9_9RICK|nr:hypothetical protein [Candidatus Trichorickettsia mobilis]WPY01382.1 hypothetical protein Trichorick_01293 [Candidatus Trichorickettsia mobilis]
MRSSDNRVTSEYMHTSQKISSCMAALSVEYILSYKKSDQTRSAWFAFGVIKVLLQYAEIFDFLNQRYKKDFIDSLRTHSDKYIKLLKQEAADSATPEVHSIFQEEVNFLIGQLSNNKLERTGDLLEQELEAIQDVVSKLIKNCRTLFAEQSHIVDMMEQLQGMAIALGITNFTPEQQENLLAKLLLIKEIWHLEPLVAIKEDNFGLMFYSNPIQFLRNLATPNIDDTFHNIINFFVHDHQALLNISDIKLINLYDRLKDLDNQDEVFTNLLQKIHQEAPFRYNYNRIGDSGYELLKRFQSYDAIFHQIENAEFHITEAFLLRNNNFIQETLMLLAKHVDNIRAVGASKSPVVHTVLNKLEIELEHNYPSDSNHKSTISAIKDKLALGLDSQIINRYSELNKFTVFALKSKYLTLFEQIKRLLDDDSEDDKGFLNQILVKRFAQDYYIANASNSIVTLRSIASDRSEIVRQCSEIDFVEIFNPECTNKITSLNFKKQIMASSIKTVNDYVEVLLKLVTSLCSASQLDCLYRPLLYGNLTKTQQVLKRELSKQIKQRTTIAKMVYSVFTGKKNEYNRLKVIKESASVIPKNMSNVQSGLKEIGDLPTQLKKNLQSFSSKSSHHEETEHNDNSRAVKEKVN